MKIAHSPAQLERQPRAVAIGTFDGMHRGHRAVVQSAIDTGLAPTVITFDPHPRLALGNHVELITTLERRLELIAAAGAEATLVAGFTPELMALAPEEFVERYLLAIGAEAVAAGSDFRFGAKRRGDLELLQRMGLQVLEVPHVPGVSSSAVRLALHEGDVAAAAPSATRPRTSRSRRTSHAPATASTRAPPTGTGPPSRSGRIRITAARSGGSSPTCSISRAISTASAWSSRCGSACGTRPSSLPRTS